MCYERDRGRALTNSPYTPSLPIYEWWVGNATDFNCNYINVKYNNYAKKNIKRGEEAMPFFSDPRIRKRRMNNSCAYSTCFTYSKKKKPTGFIHTLSISLATTAK